MSNISDKTLSAIKKYLLRQQREVEKEQTLIQDSDPATSPSLAESSEPGTDSWIADSHNRILALGNQLGKRAITIRKALFKIRSGSYGRCEKCKKEIDPARLKAMPEAQLCLSCSKKISV